MKLFNEQETRSLKEMKKDVLWNIDYHKQKLEEYQSKFNALNKITLVEDEDQTVQQSAN